MQSNFQYVRVGVHCCQRRESRSISDWFSRALAMLLTLLPLPVAAFDAAGYLPLADGSQWTMRQNGFGNYVMQILPGTAVVNGAPTKVLQDWEGDRLYATNDASGIRIHREFLASAYISGYGYTSGSIDYYPPAQYLPASFTVGSSASGSGSVLVQIPGLGNYWLSYSSQGTAIAFETVTVPAGTFHALRFISSVTITGYVGTSRIYWPVTTTFWLVDGAGPVKIAQSDGDLQELTSSSLLDNQPNPIGFAPVSGIAAGAMATSQAVTLSGFNSLLTLSVFGGEYSLNDGPFTTSPTLARSGDTVRMRRLASSTPGATVRTTLTLGQVAGNFDVTTASPPAPIARTHGDLNGDGRAELVWRNSSTGENTLWLMNGTGIDATSAAPPVADTTWKVIAIGDFNADGRADIFWRQDGTGQNAVWLMNGAGISSALYLPTVTSSLWKPVATGDFNGDGRADILWRHDTTGENAVWLMNGATVTAAAFTTTVPDTAWKVVGAGDLDGNGRADILWRHSGTGENVMWFMSANGIGMSGWAYLPTVADAGWKVQAVADFNANSRADILWRHDTSGEAVLWLMDGASVVAGGFLPTVSNPAWKIVAVRDFSGDARADILWRHDGTGENVLWLMNGLGMSNWGYLPTVPNADWRVVGGR